MKLHTHTLRVMHKWIGLVIGLQVILWTLSGAGMAFLDMEEVAGGASTAPARPAFVQQDAWPRVQEQLSGAAISSVALRPLLDRYVYEVSVSDRTALFDAVTGQPISIGAERAIAIAKAHHVGSDKVSSVKALDRVTLAVREHELPIWQVDFADRAQSSIYVSGRTGAVLERRNDTWRLWDFLWMLHNMDYLERKSFNHPLIVAIGFAAVWLTITGFYLLFRTGWRSDWKRRKRAK